MYTIHTCSTSIYRGIHPIIEASLQYTSMSYVYNTHVTEGLRVKAGPIYIYVLYMYVYRVKAGPIYIYVLYMYTSLKGSD